MWGRTSLSLTKTSFSEELNQDTSLSEPTYDVSSLTCVFRNKHPAPALSSKVTACRLPRHPSSLPDISSQDKILSLGGGGLKPTLTISEVCSGDGVEVQRVTTTNF